MMKSGASNDVKVTRPISRNQARAWFKKVRGQSEAALQVSRYVQPKTLISVEAKKLLIKNLFNYSNDI